MSNYIYKDYCIDNNWLSKGGIKESVHLMWKAPFFGSPCIDAQVWDNNKDKLAGIVITTDKKRKFTCPKEMFEKEKQLFDHGSGTQYGIPKECWDINLS